MNNMQIVIIFSAFEIGMIAYIEKQEKEKKI